MITEKFEEPPPTRPPAARTSWELPPPTRPPASSISWELPPPTRPPAARIAWELPPPTRPPASSISWELPPPTRPPQGGLFSQQEIFTPAMSAAGAVSLVLPNSIHSWFPISLASGGVVGKLPSRQACRACSNSPKSGQSVPSPLCQLRDPK